MAPIDNADLGVWGKPTSTLDWCEENYVVTLYVAEFWNTMTSAILIVLPFVTMCCFRSAVERRMYVICTAFMIVGVGSWWFHMTLLYGTQLMDELPMIWGTCVLVYFFYENEAKPKVYNYPLIAFLSFVALFTTAVYLITRNPVLHQVTFGLLVSSCYIRVIYCLLSNKQTYTAPSLILSSVSMYAIGFMLWSIDNHYCTQIRSLRSVIPAPVNAVFQLHGLWHLFAGLGAHFQVIYCCHSRFAFLKRNYSFRNISFIPFITIDGPRQ